MHNPNTTALVILALGVLNILFAYKADYWHRRWQEERQERRLGIRPSSKR